MVSFQTPISSSCVNKVPEYVENMDHRSSSKRKSMDHHNNAEERGESLIKQPKTALSLHSTPGLDSRIESLLETPLPVDWQQCLDIQSGKVHFYNTRTDTRTSRDPREASGSIELPRRRRSPHMRLDLELNLSPCDNDSSSDSKFNKLLIDLNSKSLESHNNLLLNSGINKENNKQIINVPTKNKSSTVVPSSVPSWFAFEGDEKSEMVATVCKRCFMLVMLCKASPACPNCKFMHSPDQSTPHLFKRTLSQLLY